MVAELGERPRLVLVLSSPHVLPPARLLQDAAGTLRPRVPPHARQLHAADPKASPNWMSQRDPSSAGPHASTPSRRTLCSPLPTFPQPTLGSSLALRQAGSPPGRRSCGPSAPCTVPQPRPPPLADSLRTPSAHTHPHSSVLQPSLPCVCLPSSALPVGRVQIPVPRTSTQTDSSKRPGLKIQLISESPGAGPGLRRKEQTWCPGW